VVRAGPGGASIVKSLLHAGAVLVVVAVGVALFLFIGMPVMIVWLAGGR